MTTTLCETFRALAFRTFDQMGRARRVGHQPLEETFTDTNILELKDRHPDEIYCRTFNKPEEGRNGADWEWWLSNHAMTSWLGLRVQAKVLHLTSDTFAHLHYKSGKSKVYQLTKLKREAAKEGLVPLYCIYSHEATTPRVSPRRCGSFAQASEAYGCALATLAHIEELQVAGEKRDYADVLRGALPWHCLVCCSGYGGDDLPSRAWSLLQGGMDVKSARLRRASAEAVGRAPLIGIRSGAPEYVCAVIEGRAEDTSPKKVGGVLVLRGKDQNQRASTHLRR